jgi:hypothetical protein
MAVAHITPQNWQQFVTQNGMSADPRQYFAWHTLHYLKNRAGVHRSAALKLARGMRKVADGLSPDKPEAIPQQPEAIGLYTLEEKTAERQRLRTMADYLESIVDQFAPDPEPAHV